MKKTQQQKQISGTYRKDRDTEINPNDVLLDHIPKPPKDFSIFELEFYNDESNFLFSVDMLTRNRLKRIVLNATWWHLFKSVQPKLREDNGMKRHLLQKLAPSH